MAVIELGRSGHVLSVVLDRPEKRNAINNEMRDRLLDVLEIAEIDETVSGIVFTGAGTAFCAGADLTEFTDKPVPARTKENRRRRDLFGRLATTPVVTVAVLHGFALGSGLELALLCDVRVSTRGTRVGLPEARLGMIPPAGGTQMLPRIAGVGHALWLTLLAQAVPIEAPQASGLVDEIVDAGEEAVRAWTERLNAHEPSLVRAVKRSMSIAATPSLVARLRPDL